MDISTADRQVIQTLFPDHAPTHALAVATRLAQRQEQGLGILDAMFDGRLATLAAPALEVAVETGEPIGKALAHRFALEATDELAGWLAGRLSQARYAQVWPLHELALLATERYLTICRAAWPNPGRREQEMLAALAHNHGRHLLTVGREAEALPFLQEAIAYYRRRPRRRATLIQCLASCSEALARLGRLDAALTVAEKAVAASRREVNTAARGRLPAARLALAGELINLCSCLADVERHADALAAITESISLLRRYRRHWQDLGQAYARALLSRGNELYHLGRYGEALASLEQAIDWAQQLEVERTSAFEPDLALALTDLSLLYQQLGQVEKASRAWREATARYRNLEDQYPGSFRPSLAWSLSSFSRSYRSGDAGPEDRSSLAARTEAVEILRRLAAQQPRVHEANLAHGLFDLGESLLEAGDAKAALAASNEAVTRLRRRMARGAGRELQRDLAWSLLLRGRIRSALGQRPKALADSRQAVALLRERCPQQASFYEIDLAAALQELGVRLHEVGRFDEAVEVGSEAVARYRRLARSARGMFDGDLADALDGLGLHLYYAGFPHESLAATRESVARHRKRTVLRRGADAGLAASLSNLGLRHCQLGRFRQALAPAREAVELYRRMEPADDPALAAALLSLGSILLELKRPGKALPILEESVALTAVLGTARPAAHGADLAFSLGTLGQCLSALERYGDALIVTRRAVRLLRQSVRRGNGFLRTRLAMALNNQSHQLRMVGRPRAALAAAEESLELLTPDFLARPAAHLQWLLVALGNYLAAAEGAGEEPDLDRLTQLLAVLHKLGISEIQRRARLG